MASDLKLCYFTLHSQVHERAVTMKKVGIFFWDWLQNGSV